MKKIINNLFDIKNYQGRLKILVISLVIQFVISGLLYLGVRAPEQLEFLKLPQFETIPAMTAPVVTPNIYETEVQPKLEMNKSTFRPRLNEVLGSRLVQTAQAGGEYDQASGYIVVSLEDGQVLAEKNADKRLPIASVTKIMTAIVALDLASQEELFTVSETASEIIPTKIGVVAGQKMRLDELLHALMLTSANDAAGVIQEGIDQKYGEPVFIQAMNAKAEVLGMKNSKFTNPQGFDHEDHYSSSEDLAILSAYALEYYPLFKQVVGKQYQFLAKDQNHKQFDLYNWNGLLGVYPGTYGIKIGSTPDAKMTTTVISEREGNTLLVVLLGAPTALERDLWSAQLLDLGFSSFGIEPANINEEQLRAKYATWKFW